MRDLPLPRFLEGEKVVSAKNVCRMFYLLKMDTMRIAEALRIPEHQVCKLLHEGQRARRYTKGQQQ
jgi:DNA-binding transcriptional regulator LsrR (DeoR family)